MFLAIMQRLRRNQQISAMKTVTLLNRYSKPAAAAVVLNRKTARTLLYINPSY